MKKALGHKFNPMSEGDWDAFAGADEGTLICYLDEITLLLTPEGSIVAVNYEDGTETIWTPVQL